MAIDYDILEIFVSTKWAFLSPLHPMQKTMKMEPMQTWQLGIRVIVKTNSTFILLADNITLSL